MILCVPRRGAALFLCLLILSSGAFAADPLEKLADADHWKKVRALSQERLRNNPNDAHASFLLSKAELSFGEVEAAIEPAEKAIEVDGSQADYHAQAAEVYARMAQRVGVLKQMVYVHKLKHELEAAFAIDPRNLDASLVRMMFDWKAPSFAGGDRRKALQVVDELKAWHPVWGYLAEAKLVQDVDETRTEKALEQASAAGPGFYLAQASLAEFYSNVPTRLADAERLAKICIQLDPGRAAAYGILARVYAAQRRNTELDRVLAQSEKQVPDDLSPYYFAAKTLISHNGDVSRAEQYTRKYLSKSPEGRAPGVEEAREFLASIGKPGTGHGTRAAISTNGVKANTGI
jgi:tetratricopeptide (TPR) repeat protein